ncbi:MAG: low-complexity tail membrane protein [Vulcanococcus sp.]|uniref:low-complexity tail membrane protein n=1 Tax=Vulcanococcus sp. TaxID=2856995 RepID=UPI0025DD899B|nr:low-complexity tail membrane protein [Vulcanococcus sp.]MBW0175206.1 low-complexity tail membrane protein [Vulcanococcus sp.]MBW0180467.1 low-complexity tail membrane protein [Vulcanococcus sp.]
MNPARREPLLWLQLLGLAALPLEALLLLLVLAGADPGPLPGFERVLAWALGALAPAVLFWQLPPDLWSLLLLQVPLRGRRPEQLRLSALQTALPLKLLAASGAALLLPLVWLMDAKAGLAWAWSPLSASPRLVVLLVSLPLLALMQWHWHQLMQTLWLFTRPEAEVEQTLPLTQAQAADDRLNLGLPLLLLPPLEMATPAPQPEPTTKAEPAPEPTLQPEPEPQQAPEASTEPVAVKSEKPAEQTTPEPIDSATEAVPEEPVEDPDSGDLVIDAGVAVAPEETAKEHESSKLDSEVAESDGLTS